MVAIRYTSRFRKKSSRVKDEAMREQLAKLMEKIIENPEIGKPTRYARKYTREIRMAPYRVAYAYRDDTVTFLDIYHKDEQ